MSKTEITSETKSEGKISVCDIMKTNTSKIIQKLESKIPSRHQQYSDLYAAYLHTIDDIYGTCYISEKEFFDKLKIDQGVLHSIQDYSKTITDTYLAHIDIYAKSTQDFVQNKISSLIVYDDFIHTMMDSYAKALSQFNKAANSSNS